jgi:hypothetical protein
MKSIKIALLLSLCACLYAESLGSVNLDYEKSRIKKKAENASSNNKVCYQYVEISGKQEWERRKDELNTYIRNNSSSCKKYVIYKEVRNVNTRGSSSSASNNSQGDYDINIGVIMEENPEVDITIYTQVKNSTLQDGRNTHQKANVGGVVVETDEDIDLENIEITAISNVENSEIGELDMAEEYELDSAEKFLKEDKDDPFNN